MSDDTPGGHLAPTFYGTAGLGVYYPLAKQPGFAGVFTGGVGAAYDRENKLMSLARLSGGPSFPSWDSGTDLTVLDLPLNRLTVNIFISMDYLNEEVWFHLSPQVGLASMPTSK